VKIRIQLTPASAGALLCTVAWFALWLLAFRPALPEPVIKASHPEFIRLIADDATLDKLKTPTLFALPSTEGFSGPFFLENRIDLRPALEKTNSPIRYLSPEKIDSPGAVDRSQLMEETALPRSALPAPGAAPRTAIRPAAETQLFFSPELKLRAGDTPQLSGASAGMSGTLRVNLTIRTDGTVEYVFFETPVTNTALLSAIRQLRFKPASEQTESWIDIRFAQEGKE
jgi:hypothetical protein